VKIDRRYKPELCVEREGFRSELADPYFDPAHAEVVATDGHLLISVPAAVEPGDAPGYVSDRHEFGAPRKFPAWRSKALPTWREGDEGTVSVCLNATFLLRLARALDARERQVVLTFRVRKGEASKDPILVRARGTAWDDTTEGDPEAFGLLMPVMFKRRTPEEP
jgi:hypothetical protein